MEKQKPKFGPEMFSENDIIISQGDVPEKFYIISAGQVFVEHSGEQGTAVIDQLGPGDFFGEVGLVKNSRRNATVRAKTDVYVMTMGLESFNNWLQSSALITDEIHNLINERELRIQQQEKSSDTTPHLGQNTFSKILSKKQHSDEDRDGPTPTATGPVAYNAKEIIFNQGAKANRFYIIIKGMVEIVQVHDEQENIIGTLSDGDYFGEIGLLEGHPRTATVRARTPIKVLPFTRTQFISWLQKSPDSEDAIKDTALRRLTRDTDIATQKE